MNIVLVEPEIPQNTGNIVRTCAGTNSVLHLVRPLGFSVEDKYLKRAGLDYWHFVEIHYYDSFEEVVEKAIENNGGLKPNFWYATTKGRHKYSDVKYSERDYIVFGKETKGLPEKLLADNYASCIRIPMREEFRSLNLSNAVAVVVYEAMRQLGFPELEIKGSLREYDSDILEEQNENLF